MPQNSVGFDPKTMAVTLAGRDEREQPSMVPLTPECLGELIRAQTGGQPMQITVNVNQVVSASGPAAALWRAFQVMARSSWTPWHPFAVIYRSYQDGYAEAVRYPGLLRTVFWMAIATGLGAILWRQWTMPISAVGGLLAFLVIIKRTGQLRETLDAFQAAGGLPPILAALQYTWIIMLQKAKRR